MKPIGALIKDELVAQERTVSWFARKLHTDRSNIYRLFQKNSVDTELLGRICIVLNKDFFALLSRSYVERNDTQTSELHS
jgi:hypothetical protein